MGERVHLALIASEAAHPMVLRKAHPVLIVCNNRHVLGYVGHGRVLFVIRQLYWILRARSLVRQILSKCVNCRNRNASTMQQVMADLPRARVVVYSHPFTYTGLDFFGLFYMKRGRSIVKVSCCIFVCFNSQAIHIEDVSSLEADTFIQALCRFIAVRGCPKQVWSDNGTNFTGAERKLHRSVQYLNEELLKRELHPREAEWYIRAFLEWRFQLSAACHMSEVRERLIRSVRKATNAVLFNQGAVVSLEILRTVFAEVTSILNSRPICLTSDDPNDIEPLTPNHLLL